MKGTIAVCLVIVAVIWMGVADVLNLSFVVKAGGAPIFIIGIFLPLIVKIVRDCRGQ